MNTFTHVPPGFRFHPTDEELVDYYLRKKIASKRIDLDVIKDVDLYRIEPWDLQDKCKIGTEEQNEWYFFSHKDKKYPTGTRTNRATTAGFWKATGRDKAIYSKHNLIGMRKTLVFYKGRAPNGQKSDWIMHEYRLETNENGPPQASDVIDSNYAFFFLLFFLVLINMVILYQEEGWVVCRVFKKRITTVQKMIDHDSPCWYEEQVSFMPDLESPRRVIHPDMAYRQPYLCKQELELQYHMPHDSFLQLPSLESPKLPHSTASTSCNSIAGYSTHDVNQRNTIQSSAVTQGNLVHQNRQHNMNFYTSNNNEQGADQVTDWRVMEKFVASQLSQEDALKEPNLFQETEHMNNILARQSNKQEMAHTYGLTSTSSCEVDLLNLIQTI